MLTAEVPAGFPTLRIVFEPEDGSQSIGRILKAWDRQVFVDGRRNTEEDGDATWWPLDVRFADDRISRDGLQADLLAATTVERADRPTDDEVDDESLTSEAVPW